MREAPAPCATQDFPEQLIQPQTCTPEGDKSSLLLLSDLTTSEPNTLVSISILTVQKHDSTAFGEWFRMCWRWLKSFYLSIHSFICVIFFMYFVLLHSLSFPAAAAAVTCQFVCWTSKASSNLIGTLCRF